MADIINDLEIVKRRIERLNGFGEEAEVIDNVISMLKAQEPIKPKVNIDTWVCGNCGTRVEHESMIGPNAVLAETFKFCPECGRAVKWDELPKEET